MKILTYFGMKDLFEIKDDKEFIIVILGSGRTENGLSERFLDSKELFEYAFNFIN